jgi:hypothetical protein
MTPQPTARIRVLSEMGLGLTCAYIFLSSLYGPTFAKIHASLPGLPFPIFVGEILLLICLGLTAALWANGAFPPLSSRVKGTVIVYLIFITLKTGFGYWLHGPLALRNAVMFIYVFFTFFVYGFSRDVSLNKLSAGIILALLSVLLVLGAVRQSFRYPCLMFMIFISWRYFYQQRWWWAAAIGLLTVCLGPKNIIPESSKGALVASLISTGWVIYKITEIKKRGVFFLPAAILTLLAVIVFADKASFQSLWQWHRLKEALQESNSIVRLNENKENRQDFGYVKLYDDRPESMRSPIYHRHPQNLESQSSTDNAKPAQKQVQKAIAVLASLSEAPSRHTPSIAQAPPPAAKPAETALKSEDKPAQKQEPPPAAKPAETALKSEDKPAQKKVRHAIAVLASLSEAPSHDLGKGKPQRASWIKEIKSPFMTRDLTTPQTPKSNITNMVWRIFVNEDMLKEWLTAGKPQLLWGIDFGKPFLSRRINILAQVGNWSAGESVGWIEPHNSYVHILYRSGLVGIMFLLFGLSTFLGLVKKSFELSSPLPIFVLESAFIYWLILSNFEVIFELPYFAISVWSLLGFAAAFISKHRPASGETGG